MRTTVTNKSIFAIEGITKSFNQQKVLDDISLTFTRGKSTVIIGPSGCGKTVLLKHLIGLINPDEGKVFFNDTRVDTLPQRKIMEMRQRCGFLFQSSALFDSETIFENIAFPMRQKGSYSSNEIRNIVNERLKMVNLPDIGEKYPAELSGGQQKRAALARAIALSPEVILYDEPTTGLDPIRSDIINDLVIKLQSQLDITSIVVTHDMKSAFKIADHLVMLNNGTIVTQGTTEEIKKSKHPIVQEFIYGKNPKSTNP